MSAAAWAAAGGAALGLALVGAARRRREKEVRGKRQDAPRHVAFVMDGNRRWASHKYGAARRLEGHAAGGRKLGEVAAWCAAAGVREMTVFAFSTENWERDPAEVDLLMRTFVEQSDEILDKCVARGVRCVVRSSSPERLPPEVRAALARLEAGTAAGGGLLLNLCVSYGGRGELANAAAAVAARVARGDLALSEVDEAAVERELALPSSVDLLVRTSGERRLSNFLLWQSAYAELVFVEKHWPDLGARDVDAVLDEYARRRRRFGR